MYVQFSVFEVCTQHITNSELTEQKDLLAILISQSDVRTPDLRSSVLEAVGGDQEALAAIEQ